MPITLYCVEMDGSKDWKNDRCSVRRLKKRQTGGGGKLKKAWHEIGEPDYGPLRFKSNLAKQMTGCLIS